MNLNQWKTMELQRQRNLIKSALREGVEFTASTVFSNEQIEEIKEELQVEMFYEQVYVEDEIELTEATDEEGLVQEVTEFDPDPLGESYDVEIEIDTDLYNIDESTLEAIQGVMFAEGFVVIDEASKAKVVFTRSKGKISKKKKCGKGMTLKGNKCIPQTGAAKAKNRMLGIKIKRAKKAVGGGAKKKAALKAKITKKRVQSRARNFSGIGKK